MGGEGELAGERRAPGARLASIVTADEVLKREASNPPLPVADGVEAPDRVGGSLGVELMIAAGQSATVSPWPALAIPPFWLPKAHISMRHRERRFCATATGATLYYARF